MLALITGASSGIGYEMAKYLSKLGYDIIAVGRNIDLMETLKKECSTNVETICLDLAEEKNCFALFEKTKEKEIDILVNCAGFGDFGEFSETSLTKELSMIKVNIVALHTLMKLYLQKMCARNSGYILNVASIAGFMPGPLMATYYASKAYVVRITEAIHIELKKQKSRVRVAVLCPGPVDTNFNQVAGVKFGIHQLTSQYVAKYAIDKMFQQKLVIIPGLLIKLIHFAAKITPDKLLAKSVYRMQTKKKG